MTASRTVTAAYVWKDFSRFVEVSPVELGWLVLWGRYRQQGNLRELAGNRTYLDLPGARRRVADSVFELTRRPALVAEAMLLFDRTPFPPHSPGIQTGPL